MYQGPSEAIHYNVLKILKKKTYEIIETHSDGPQMLIKINSKGSKTTSMCIALLSSLLN